MSRAAADIVDAAIREGKFPESRRAHYMECLAKRPKKTARLIASLEGGLLDHLQADDEEGRLAVQQATGGAGSRAAPVGARPSGPGGPTAYPKEWLGLHGSGVPAGQTVVESASGGRSPITMESPTVAAECMPGANVPEGLDG
jgi:hypothetical protein